LRRGVREQKAEVARLRAEVLQLRGTYNPPSAAWGANVLQVIVPVMGAPSLLLASTVNVPPFPDFANVTLPDPLVVRPPRTVFRR
jgi:hypothetical protein